MKSSLKEITTKRKYEVAEREPRTGGGSGLS